MQLDVHRIPFCVLVDAEGTVRYVNIRGPAIDRLVKKLVEANSEPDKASEVDQPRNERRRVGFRRGRRSNQNLQR